MAGSSAAAARLVEGRRRRDRGPAHLRLERGGLLERVLGGLALLERRLLERAVHDVEHHVALPQAEAEAADEDDDADDQPLAQLVEVLDEAETVLGADRPQRGGHARRPASASRRRPRPRRAAWRSPRRDGRARRPPGSACRASRPRRRRPPCAVIESLNSRIPAPSWRPRPGRRFGPKITSTMPRTISSSSGPTDWKTARFMRRSSVPYARQRLPAHSRVDGWSSQVANAAIRCRA